jgi:hypothetical protein
MSSFYISPIIYWHNIIRNDILDDMFQYLYYRVYVCMDIWSLYFTEYRCLWGHLNVLTVSAGESITINCKSTKVFYWAATRTTWPGARRNQNSLLNVSSTCHQPRNLESLAASVAVGLEHISLSPSAASRLKMWQITTVSRVTMLLTQCFSLEHKFPLRDSSAARIPHSPGIPHYLHLHDSLRWEGIQCSKENEGVQCLFDTLHQKSV